MYTSIKITINSELHKTDASLLGYLFENAASGDGPVRGYCCRDRTIIADVDFATYSAFCILEDLGVLEVEQL